MTKNIVIKIGSSVICTDRYKVDEFRLFHLARQIIILQRKGIKSVLVVSGAVTCGARTSLNKNIAAGIGQVELISAILKVFSKKALKIAQILLRKNDLADDSEKIKGVIEGYLDLNMIPVINENDVIDLNCFGGNDYLACEIAELIGAYKVLILSTLEGSRFGIGGGASKRIIAKRLILQGIKVDIVNGKEKNIIINSNYL